jgi:predicted nucleic acid-binding protein
MITAVDTNVLADVFSADPEFGATSADALRRSQERGRLIACEVVFAECAAAFGDAASTAAALHAVRVDFLSLDADDALATGIRWGAHRLQTPGRARVVADFIIGEHARMHADRLLTRDRGFYRRGFDDLVVVAPADA